MARLKEQFKKTGVDKLKKELSIQNNHEVPQLKTILVSMCLSEAKENRTALEKGAKDLEVITGQKPLTTHARKSIANFKLRKGEAIGLKVTLRRERMYEFFDRLVNVALPRVRDFRGVPKKSFDGRGNYTLGIKEQIIFPEINYDSIDKVRGFNITFVTSAKNDQHGEALLRNLGMPFRQA